MLIRQNNVQMCNTRKNPYPPHGRSLEIPRRRGVLKPIFLKAKDKTRISWGERGVQNENPSVGGGGGEGEYRYFLELHNLFARLHSLQASAMCIDWCTFNADYIVITKVQHSQALSCTDACHIGNMVASQRQLLKKEIIYILIA